MDFFNAFRRDIKTKGLLRESETKADTGVSGGDYKQNITYVYSAEQAMRIAAVYRAVNLISSAFAVLEMRYKRLDRAKGYFKIYDTGEGAVLNYLLSVKPNSRMNAYTLKKYIAAQMLLLGNAFLIRKRGNPGELILCSPGTVAYDVYTNKYTITDTINDICGEFDAANVLHFKNMCSDGGYWGRSTISFAKDALSIAATADNETLKRYGTGGRFKAILQNDKSAKGFGAYQDEQLKGQAEDINEILQRGDDIIAVKGDGTLTPISMSSADMQFLESRKFTIREIARFFNVPPSKLMDDSNANYKSVEVSNIAFYAEALQPIVEEIEAEFAAKMLLPTTCRDYKFSFDLSNLYALDLDSKAKWNKSRLDTGLATVNEIRVEADKEPVEGGDEVYLSTNLAKLGSDKLGNTSAATTGKE